MSTTLTKQFNKIVDLVVNPTNTNPARITLQVDAADSKTINLSSLGGGGVSSVNSLTGAVTVAAGSNITVTPSGNTLTIASTAGVGTVTTASVVSANGLAGTVANPTTTPAFTLSTTITGILKGNGTAILAAVPADFPTLNQNTTGTATSVTGTNVVLNTNLAQMAAHTYKGNNTGSLANAADITATQLTADLNQFTSTLQGVVPLSGGGTTNFLRADGTWSSPPAGFTNPMTTLGDIIYENSVPAAARLAGNTTLTKKFLVQTGNGTVSAAPVWGTIVVADVPTLNQNTTGTASGNTTYTPNNHGVVISSATNAMTVIAPDASTTKVLTSGGLNANPTWQNVAAASSNLSVASKTANYTLLTTDDLILADSSGGTFTLTLPTAVGNTGKVFRLKKTDTSLIIVTIATTLAQTIDGVTTRQLNTPNEEFAFVSDGSNWRILDHKSSTAWLTSGTWTPSAGFGTVSSQALYWRREGDSVRVRAYWQNGTTAPSPGFITIPFTIDTNKIGNKNMMVGYVQQLVGQQLWNPAAQNVSWLVVDTASNTQVAFTQGSTTTQYNLVTSVSGQININGVSIEFCVPISGWDE